MAKTRRIHLINPRADTFATRPLFFGKALYSPVAGLLAVAALIPEDDYEIILTDENIEPIDFDLKVDMVGISAMTSYVNRGYEIADTYRARGIPGHHGRSPCQLYATRGTQACRCSGRWGIRADHGKSP